MIFLNKECDKNHIFNLENQYFSSHTMVMSLDANYSGAVSDEELARIKIAKAKKRFFILFITLLILVGVRVVVKNPPKPKLPDHSRDSFRVLPGVLESLPVAEQMKLSPKIVAALREADLKEQAKRAPELAEGEYVPAQAPVENVQEKAEYERLVLEFETKRKRMAEKQKILARDLTKGTLVLFNNGGYLKAEEALRLNNTVQIVCNKGLSAKLPGGLIREIKGNAVDWEEPIPRGFVKLQPAKGITIMVAKDTSQRITVLKWKKDNEI